jgi:hypothetical protein
MFAEHEINFLVSSDIENGASNKSADGSQFEVQLQDPLKIPKDAINPTVSIEESNIWWTVPNIINGLNDKFYMTAPNAGDVLTPFNITVPQGLYDLSGLAQAILRELANAGAKTNPSPVLTFSPDDATQKVEIKANYVGTQIDFTQPQTSREILGFNAQVLGPNGIAPFSWIADNPAAFNTVNYFLIHSSLVSQGIRINNSYNQILGQVLIDVPPGSQITSSPRHPARVNASELRGGQYTNLRFWLTDDKNRAVNTSGENWSARIVIRYLIPHVVQ